MPRLTGHLCEITVDLSSLVEIDYGFFRVVGPYFIGKSLGTLKVLIFGLWSLI